MRCRSELKYGGRAKVPKSGWKQGSLQDCECVVMFSTVAQSEYEIKEEIISPRACLKLTFYLKKK